jgi:hypothetical protein
LILEALSQGWEKPFIAQDDEKLYLLFPQLKVIQIFQNLMTVTDTAMKTIVAT